jgi:hypothetical protein
MRLRQSADTFLVIVVALLVSVAVTSLAFASTSDDPSKRVKIVGGGLEFVDVKPTTEKCGKQKDGEAIRLRVTSDSPIDVRMYMRIAGGGWVSQDFPNQKKGDEINSFRCDTKPNYKIYSHAEGSTDAWPKP